jgi:uncharacterized repeat protein (TIGR01451 family)
VDVAVAVTASASEVLLGSTVEYAITVTNGGPSVATGVTVEDVLPVELSLVEVVTTQGTAMNENGVVRVELGELGRGSNAVVTLTLRADQLGLVTNSVTVQSVETEVDPTNNQAEAVVVIVPAADVGVAVVASAAKVILANELRYAVTVTNQGPSIATAVWLEDVLPGGVSFVRFEMSQGTGTVENGTVRVDLGELGVGSTALVTLTVQADQLGPVTNRVSVAAAEGDPQPTNNTAIAETMIKLPAEVGVAVAASASQVFLGRELRYDIAVTNAGPGLAADVLLEDDLPGGVEFLALETSQGSGTNESGVVRVGLGELGVGSNALVTLWVRADEAGQWTNVVRLAPSPLDPDPANDEATVETVILPYARFRLSQSVSPAPVLINDSLRYTFAVSNTGPYTVSDATLVDTLPAEVELLSITGSQGTYSTTGNVVTYDLGTLPVDSAVRLTITVAPRVVGSVTNAAVLSSAFADPADGTFTSRIVTPVVGQPPLTYVLSGTKLTLYWPTLANDYLLETTTQLSPPAWVEDRNPQVIVGDRITVTVKTFGGQACYRLRKP